MGTVAEVEPCVWMPIRTNKQKSQSHCACSLDVGTMHAGVRSECVVVGGGGTVAQAPAVCCRRPDRVGVTLTGLPAASSDNRQRFFDIVSVLLC